MSRIAMVLVLFCSFASAADDTKVIKLEQDMRNIERRVSDLSRQVTELQRASRTGTAIPETASRPSDLASATPAWLAVGNWKRVRRGMTEMEVIEVLGPPTSLRGDPASAVRTMMYAMEIGSAAFLSGSVRLENRLVVEVEVPTLK